MDVIISKWRDLLNDNKLEELFEDMEKLIADEEFRNFILLHSSEYQDLEKSRIKGINISDYKTAVLSLKSRILSVINRYEKHINKYHLDIRDQITGIKRTVNK